METVVSNFLSLKNQKHLAMVLDHPLDGVTNPKYKLLHLLSTNKICKEKKALAFNRDGAAI